jgi:hypothetical protein
MRAFVCAPTGIRTPVVALKGPRPSPLDDGGARLDADEIVTRVTKVGQGNYEFRFFRALLTSAAIVRMSASSLESLVLAT